MARILVTGGAGYIGSHIAKALYAAGHEPVVLDNLSRGHRDFIRWGTFIQGDVRDAQTLQSVFASMSFHGIIHLAALAYVSESVEDPNAYYENNVCGTRNLLSAMVQAKVSNLVFSSSCAVYGEPDRLPILEETPCNPINPYGFTKWACERMMMDFQAAYGLRSVRLRYFNSAGADPAGQIGEDHDPETHLIPLLLGVAQGKRTQFSIYGRDYPTRDGTAERDYIHVEDLAAAHLAALSHLLDGGASLSLNLGTGQGATVWEVLQAVERVTGHSIPHEIKSRRKGDPAQLVADASKAYAKLAWHPKHSDLDRIVADAWRWHQRRFG